MAAQVCADRVGCSVLLQLCLRHGRRRPSLIARRRELGNKGRNSLVSALSTLHLPAGSGPSALQSAVCAAVHGSCSCRGSCSFVNSTEAKLRNIQC